jgi:polyferredoxin
MVGTTERILRHTSPFATERIRQRTEDRLRALATSRADIPERLAALEFEWDIERCIFMGASIMSLLSFLLALLFGWGWLLIAVVISTFLLVHATHGWAPPLPILRRLGVRTMREIDDERAALRAMANEKPANEKPRADAAA